MISLEKAQEIIDKHIKSLNLNSQPIELYEPIKYILSLGGKRIRPSLTIMSCNLFSDDIELAINPAIALEIFHNFSLIHDDIMDNAMLRRNKPTVHSKWNNNVAILSGDAMCIKAYEYVLKTNDQHLKKVFEVFNQTALQVCEGQQLDMNFELKWITENEYLKMIELKTSVLLAACLKIGAITGNASEANAELLYSFGKNMGIAFQLQDDLLDITSDEVTFGKEIGKDIVSNKKTYLLIKALEIAKGEDLETLSNLISLKEFNPKAKVSKVKGIYEKLGIMEITKLTIDNYYTKAYNDLESVSVNNSKKSELKAFLISLKNRKF